MGSEVLWQRDVPVDWLENAVLRWRFTRGLDGEVLSVKLVLAGIEMENPRIWHGLALSGEGTISGAELDAEVGAAVAGPLGGLLEDKLFLAVSAGRDAVRKELRDRALSGQVMLTEIRRRWGTG